MEVSSESEEDTSEKDTDMQEEISSRDCCDAGRECQIERIRVKPNDWRCLAETKYSRENYWNYLETSRKVGLAIT